MCNNDTLGILGNLSPTDITDLYRNTYLDMKYHQLHFENINYIIFLRKY